MVSGLHPSQPPGFDVDSDHSVEPLQSSKEAVAVVIC